MSGYAMSNIYRVDFKHNNSPHMNIDGTEPKEFTAMFRHPERRNYIRAFNITGLESRLDNPEDFLGLPFALTNGIEWGYINSGGVRRPYEPIIKSNIDLLEISENSMIVDFTTNNRDLLMVKLVPKDPAEMPPGSKGLYIKIQDDLSGVQFLQAHIKVVHRR